MEFSVIVTYKIIIHQTIAFLVNTIIAGNIIKSKTHLDSLSRVLDRGKKIKSDFYCQKRSSQ